MPRQKFALEPGAPKRLELSWGWQWRTLTIHLDGSHIGSFANKTQLLAGQTFSLDDGSSLQVQLIERFWYPSLHILRNDQLLLGVASSAAWRRLGMVYLLVMVLLGAGLTSVEKLLLPHLKEYIQELRDSLGQETEETPAQDQNPDTQSDLVPLPPAPAETDSPEAQTVSPHVSFWRPRR